MEKEIKFDYGYFPEDEDSLVDEKEDEVVGNKIHDVPFPRSSWFDCHCDGSHHSNGADFVNDYEIVDEKSHGHDQVDEETFDSEPIDDEPLIDEKPTIDNHQTKDEEPIVDEKHVNDEKPSIGVEPAIDGEPADGKDGGKRHRKPCIRICKVASRKCISRCGHVWFRILVQNYGCKEERVCIVDHLDKCLQEICGSLYINGRKVRGSIEKGILLCVRPCETQTIQFAVRLDRCCKECSICNKAEGRIVIPNHCTFIIRSNTVRLHIC